jgi:hypothetical protein
VEILDFFWFSYGGLEHEFFDFPYFGNVIIPTDEIIFFRGAGQPPTSIENTYYSYYGTWW